MNTARKILSNTIAQIIGKVLIGLLGIATVKIATNYLSVEGFGHYTAVYEFLAYFGIAADLGLFTVAVREMAEKEDEIPKIIGNILSLRLILVVLATLTAVITSFFIPRFQNTGVPIGVAIASLTVILTIMNGTISSVLQAKLKMEAASFATVIGKIISVFFMVYVIFWGFPDNKEIGFYMLMVAGIIGSLIMFLTTNYYVAKLTPLRLRFDIGLWKSVLKKSLPYGIALILNTIYFRIDSMLILFMRNERELGIYAVAMRMLEQLAILPLFFMNSVLPILTKAVKEKTDNYKKIIAYSFDFLTALAVPMVVGGFLLAYPIIFIVSNPEYLSRVSEGFYGSDIAFRILVFASLFQFLNVLFAFVLIALDKQYKMLYINGACVIFKIITSLIFIPKFGFRAAALSSVISELFILICTYFAARHHLEFKLNLKNLLKIIGSALIMGLAIYLLQPITYKFLQNWNVFLLIFTGMIIYGILLYITKIVSKDMLNLLRKKEQISPPSNIPPTT